MSKEKAIWSSTAHMDGDHSLWKRLGTGNIALHVGSCFGSNAQKHASEIVASLNAQESMLAALENLVMNYGAEIEYEDYRQAHEAILKARGEAA